MAEYRKPIVFKHEALVVIYDVKAFTCPVCHQVNIVTEKLYDEPDDEVRCPHCWNMFLIE